eukprot:scaffold2527_cov337-Prasinococcus_capsulatus_cf.AAC.7
MAPVIQWLVMHVAIRRKLWHDPETPSVLRAVPVAAAVGDADKAAGIAGARCAAGRHARCRGTPGLHSGVGVPAGACRGPATECGAGRPERVGRTKASFARWRRLQTSSAAGAARRSPASTSTVRLIVAAKQLRRFALPSPRIYRQRTAHAPYDHARSRRRVGDRRSCTRLDTKKAPTPPPPLPGTPTASSSSVDRGGGSSGSGGSSSSGGTKLCAAPRSVRVLPTPR